MKVTANKAIEALKALGVKDAELVEDDAQVTYDEDTLLQSVDEARTPFVKARVETDLRKSIEATVAGKQGDKLRRILRDSFGIPAADLKDLDEVAAISKAVEFYSSTMQQDTEGLRNEITKLNASHAEALNAATAATEREVAQWKGKYAERHVLDFVTASLKDAPLNPNADRAAVAKMVKAQLEAEGVAFEYDESTSQVKILDKATMTPKFNAKGNAPYVLMEGAEAVLKPYGLWEKDTRSIPPTGLTNRNGEPYTPAPPSGTDPKADPNRAKAEQMAGMMGTGV